MFSVGTVGVGELGLALVPTLNIIVLAFVYKWTNKTRDELEGSVHGAKEQIRDDLKNGIRDRLDNVEQKLDNLDLKVSE